MTPKNDKMKMDVINSEAKLGYMTGIFARLNITFSLPNVDYIQIEIVLETNKCGIRIENQRSVNINIGTVEHVEQMCENYEFEPHSFKACIHRYT